jgi:2-C-methyl-D-erythritol 4-phosphate cytidylyltransferase
MTEAGGWLMKVDGKEAILRSSELFLNRDAIKQILVVIEPDEIDRAKQRYGGHFAFAGIKMVSGGPKWMDQVSAAAEKISPDCTHVILHDGARPCVPYTDIDAVMEEAGKLGGKEGVGVVTPARSTLLELDEGGNPVAYHLPSRFVQLLTPQAFTRAAFEEMGKTKKELHASQVRAVKGSPLNIRMGTPGDERMVKANMALLPKPVKASDGPFGEAKW